MTDHGNMFGAIEFYKAAKKAGIKPLIGMEAYVAPASRKEKKGGGKAGKQTAYHLLLLAKNSIGYRNLMKLSSLAYLEGFYYRARIDHELLRQYREGLIVLSACMNGEVFKHLAMDNLEGARKIVEFYLDLFGEDYYLEIQNHHIPEEAGYEKVFKLGKEMGVPVVATNDVHYLMPGDHVSHDILLCLQSGKALNDPNRLRYQTEELYLKSSDEMYQVFKDRSEVLERTMEIAEKIDLEIELGKPLLPRFPLPPEFQSLRLDDYLERQAYEGATKLYGTLTPEIKNRLDYELAVIKETGFAGYFLIVQDFIDFARRSNIPVGLGRGSAAGSLVAYALGITRVDPLKYDLLFERFLNPDRVTMPDIDIDFCYERRDEVIEYVRKKYGEKNVAQIITFGTMAARGVVRDVARVLGIEYSQADKIAKLIPIHQGKPMPFQEAFETVPELKELAESGEPQIKELIRHATVLEGLVRHASVHAAGIIIAPDDITNYVPLYQTEDQNKQKVVTTQFTKNGCEDIGLLKMDFLGLRTLTVIHDCQEMLKKRGIEIDVERVPLDDKETYEIFCDGATVGVFQFESSGMREFLKKLQPNRIEDLIAMNALFRPGPMDHIDRFIDRKFGREKIDYLHPKLEPILKETYGIIVYQEQVMRVASDLAGFSLAKADILRRAMGKKNKEVMKKLRKEFIDGCKRNGIPNKTAVEIYELIEKFASYGFNKSHSAAYALLAYQTAYLKCHYPSEFMAATLNSEMSDPKRIVVLIDECRRMGIEVLPPDVNTSEDKFVVRKENTISFGMAAIKNVGRAAIQSIIQTRKEHGPFENIFQFMQYQDLRLVNKKILEALVQAGALDSLEGNRAQKFAAVEMAISFAQKFQEQEKNKAQISLFDLVNDSAPGKVSTDLIQYPALPVMEEWSLQERLQREKDLLGFYISGHPLDKFWRETEFFSNLDWTDPDTYMKNKQIAAPAVVAKVKPHLTRTKQLMAFVTFEDKFGSFEGVVFPNVFEKYNMFLQVGEMVFVSGRVDEQMENSFKIICDEILPLREIRNRLVKFLKIEIDTQQISKEKVDKLYDLIRGFPGSIPLVFEVRTNGSGEGLLVKSRRYKVMLSDEFLDLLIELVGRRSIKVQN